MENTLLKQMNNSLLEKIWARFCVAVVRNVCAKFKVDRLSHFRTGACQVFITHKPFPSEINVTAKTATPNSR